MEIHTIESLNLKMKDTLKSEIKKLELEIKKIEIEIEKIEIEIEKSESEIKKLKIDKRTTEARLSIYNKNRDEENKLLEIIEKKKKDISADPRSLKNLNNTLIQLRKKENSDKKLLDEINNSLLQKRNLIETYYKNIKDFKTIIIQIEKNISKIKEERNEYLANRNEYFASRREERREYVSRKIKERNEYLTSRREYINNATKTLCNNNNINTILINYIENILVDNIFNSLEIMNVLENYFEQKYLYENDEFQIDYKFTKYIDSILMLTEVLYEEKNIEENNPYLIWLTLLSIKGNIVAKKIDKEYGKYIHIDSLIKNIVENYNTKLISSKSNIILDISYYYAIKENLMISTNKLEEYYNELLIKFDKNLSIIEKREKKEQFKNLLLLKSTTKKYTIDDIDLMSGLEFELFLKNLFESQKYQVNITKKTGDQGIDIIIENKGQRIGIQAKRYSSTVGNSAVQEAIAGKAYYNLNKVIVVTNNYFTKSAIELAEVNDVILWDRNILKEKL